MRQAGRAVECTIRLLACLIGEPRQVERPTLVAGDALAQALPAISVAIEMAMCELDPRPLRGPGREAHLDFAAPRGIRLELPLRADVPGEDEALGWLVGEHPGPLALAPVDTAVVHATAGARLQHRLGDVDLEQVVLARFDLVKLLRED